MDFCFDWKYVTSGTPYITLNELGISFNTPAINLLGRPEAIDIGFDRENLAIGFRKHDNSGPEKGYVFASRVKNEWIRIGCKDFIRELEEISAISFKPAKKFVAQLNSEKGYVFIALNDMQKRKELVIEQSNSPQTNITTEDGSNVADNYS